MQAVIGVDPHKRVFSAVALDERGGVVGHWHGETSRRGTEALLAWANEQVANPVWAIEGSNNRGRQLALALLAKGADVRDVCPTRTADRRQRRPGRGKSDAVDAKAIARELQAHPHLPHAFKSAAARLPDPLREELTVLVRARQQLVDRHRRLLNEAEPLLGELPARLAERLPGGSQVAPRLAAAARLRRTSHPLTNLRLELLRGRAREPALGRAHRALGGRLAARGAVQRGRRDRPSSHGRMRCSWGASGGRLTRDRVVHQACGLLVLPDRPYGALDGPLGGPPRG